MVALLTSLPVVRQVALPQDLKPVSTNGVHLSKLQGVSSQVLHSHQTQGQFQVHMPG